MADMQLFKDKGFVVLYMWEHEHLSAKRNKARCRTLQGKSVNKGGPDFG